MENIIKFKLRQIYRASSKAIENSISINVDMVNDDWVIPIDDISENNAYEILIWYEDELKSLETKLYHKMENAGYNPM